MARRFDDQEVALILREATLLDAESASEKRYHPTARGEGLTLAELKEIAAEAGIDPGRIEHAAQTLMARPDQSPFRVFLGTDSRIRVRSEFPGPLDASALSEALQEIRSVAPDQGTSSVLPGGIEWTLQDEWGSRSVSIAATPDGSRLEVTGNFDNTARLAAAGAAVTAGVGVVGVAAAAAAVGPWGLALAPVVAVGALGIPRIFAGLYVRKEGERLTQLAHRLGSFISERVRQTDTDDAS